MAPLGEGWEAVASAARCASMRAACSATTEAEDLSAACVACFLRASKAIRLKCACTETAIVCTAIIRKSD